MTFAQKIIQWQKAYGRHGLPWQVPDAYARWVSEVMLQQTQVTTVIGYYLRFMERFPSVHDLAATSDDEVMRYWAGLGYYSRARNLHKAAQVIVNDWQGFRQTREAWEALPGVGKSTAAAIVAFSFGAREAILDGNVKRVLARAFAVTEPMTPPTMKYLWALSESLLPEANIEAYTQGLMDLGAMICTRNPKCGDCPLKSICEAKSQGIEATLPKVAHKRARPEKVRTFMLLWHEDAIYLVKRPTKGIWPGLFSLPEMEGEVDDEAVSDWARAQGFDVKNTRVLEVVKHDFTHYRLRMHPIAISVKERDSAMESPLSVWIRAKDLTQLGLPAPVEKILSDFFS